ncbi:LPS-assembly protein LptD [Crenalkalicoccus roseus]|uniref:LPS-assembly protein LptD n=1 Tax=Crenalkalicoccus roseus TaxID=1485588 RepID=UPI0010810211|nr:LPS assembly protein LptD [Crenalkalicoccus roseus]
MSAFRPALAATALLAALAPARPALAQAEPTVTPADPAPRGLFAPAREDPLSARARPDTDRPVTFTADEVEYDRTRGVVTARGRVEAWQGERFMRADEFSYDRNTGIARARGNVQLLEPDGQVVFADDVELRNEFRDGVLHGVRALLAGNARLAATGARRTSGTVNELARVVYSACDLCPTDPTAPPLWQLQARRAIQDKEAQRITYRDAQVRMFGVPVLYTPYLSHPDPTAPRASGFLFPTLGYTRFLGAFIETPYFWAIDRSSDLTVTPLFSQRQYPNLGLEYRKLFNFGEIAANASIGAFDEQERRRGESLAGHIFARGRFSIDENWRAGFDLNRASSELYLRTFRYEYRRVLTSQAFAEGFWGTEGYARADARAYQGLRAIDDTRLIPFVLPNLYYEHAPRERVLGGWVTADAGLLGLWREVGSESQRLATRLRWERPEIGPIGDLWTFRLQAEALGYRARGQQEPPGFLPDANGTQAVGNVRLAVDWRLPLVRSAGAWGTQTIEPRLQLVTGPATGRQRDVPNEDSVDFEFTDANLFALNRFTGRDRQEGGTRLDTAFRAAWNFPNGGQVEGLLGRSFSLTDPRWNPYPGSGLERRASDWVARARIAPVSWFDVTGRVRLDGERPTEVRFADAVASLSLGPITLSAGYLESPSLPYLAPARRREEVGAGLAARIGRHWRLGVSGKYDLVLDRPAVLQGVAGYEDECFILEGRFMRRFAQDPAAQALYPANTVFLVRIGFKTIGEYLFRAI